MHYFILLLQEDSILDELNPQINLLSRWQMLSPAICHPQQAVLSQPLIDINCVPIES